MINRQIIDSRVGLIGWRQPFNPDFAIIDSENLDSRSGIYVNDNPFIIVELIKDTQEYKDISDGDFNEMLRRIQASSISAIVNEVFSKESYKDRQVLYPNANNKISTRTYPSGFVGLDIDVSRAKNMAFEISRIFLEFEGTGDIELLLFNSAKKEPIKSKTITITSTMQEEILNWRIDNTEGYYKGEYKLGYLTDGLTVQPIRRRYDRASIMASITDMNVDEIFVPNVTTNEMWDIEDEDGTESDTGLNPDITVYDDYTDLFIQNENLFARAVSLDMQIKILSQYIASIRSNKNQRMSEAKVIQIIEGQDQKDGMVKIKGLRPTLNYEMERIKEEIRKLRKGYEGGSIMVDTLS